MNITQTVVTERERALLGGDYSSYHAQSTRRLHTLRRRLGIATLRGRKYSPKAPVTAENVGRNKEWVNLLLASAERAWADAMAMKSLQSPENTQKPLPGSTKRQIVSRLRRAITYATNLVTVLEDRETTKASEIDVLEAKAYLALLKGGLDFEKNRWQSCMQNYSVARLIYATIGPTVKSDIYKDLLSNTVDPSIKYAAYQEKVPRTKAVPDIAIDQFPSADSEARHELEKIEPNAFQKSSEKSTTQEDVKDLPSTIEWRNRKVKVEDASISQALGLAIMKEKAVQEVFDSFTKGNTNHKDLATAYDDVITTRQDAADATKAAIDELTAEGIDQGDARVQSLQVTRTAINYSVIEWRVGRNRILCGPQDGLLFEGEKPRTSHKASKEDSKKVAKEETIGRKLARLRERVALYDSTLQNIDAVKDLPGVVADTDLVAELDAKKAYFRALKCLNIGRSHVAHSDISNALALFARAAELAEKVSSSGSTSASTGPTKLGLSTSQSEQLKAHLASLTLQYRGLADLKKLNAASGPKDKVNVPPLIQRLHQNQYEDDVDLNNLVNYPPKLQPVPVKPLFFDLAWNYIQYPVTEQTTQIPQAPAAAQPHQEEKPAKKGWFGFGR